MACLARSAMAGAGYNTPAGLGRAGRDFVAQLAVEVETEHFVFEEPVEKQHFDFAELFEKTDQP